MATHTHEWVDEDPQKNAKRKRMGLRPIQKCTGCSARQSVDSNGQDPKPLEPLPTPIKRTVPCYL